MFPRINSTTSVSVCKTRIVFALYISHPRRRSLMISSTSKQQVKMPRWRFRASEASLRLVLLLIFLEETPRSFSLVKAHDKDSSAIRTTWCKATNVCAACRHEEHPQSRPKCLGQDEPLLGADLCECCCSCVVARASGESCGSQLSVWFEDSISEGTTSILATTRCKEGLSCANFVCQELEVNASVILGQDAITLDAESVSDDEDASLTRDNDNHNPDGGLYIPETTKAVSSTATPSRTSSLPLEDAASNGTSVESTSSELQVIENSQPCYAGINDQEFEIDDPIHRVVNVVLNDKRFELVYSTKDLLAELKVLLNIIDKEHLESLLDGDETDSLVKAFAYYSDNASVKVPTPGGESEVLPELRKLVSPNPSRTKREHAPKNIGEILVRSASAHREYTEADRLQVLNSSSAESPNQGDESTVRVRITTHPRKVHTLIDLVEEEKEDEKEEERGEEDEELSDDMKLVYGRRSEVKEDPLPRPKISRLKEVHRVASSSEEDDVTTNYLNVIETRWNKTFSGFNDRLTNLELRIEVFERILEEMAKWCNLGAPATRDCILPQDANFQVPGQWGFAYQDPEARDRPSVDEHLALGSGINAVRLRDDRRRLLNSNVPLLKKDPGLEIGVQETEAPRHLVDHRAEDSFDSSQQQPQSHRMVSPIRRLGGFRKWKNRRPPDFLGASTRPRPCYRKSVRRGYPHNPSWREPIVEAVAEPPVHRMAQRSVVEDQVERNAVIIPEAQMKKPKTPLSAIVLYDRIKNSDRSYIDQKEMQNLNSMASAAEENSNSEIGITEFQESEVSQRDSGRSKRSLERDDHGFSRLLHQALRKIRSGSSVPTRDVERGTKLFKMQPQSKEGGELVAGSWSKLPETNVDLNALRRRFIALPLIFRNSGSDSYLGDNDDNNNNDNQQTATAMQWNRMTTLFKNNAEALQSQDSTSAGKEKTQDLRGPLEESLYAITSHGNSTIPIEEISDADEYGDTLPQFVTGDSLISEDDFDHLYESSEAEDEDFDYTKRLEYIDSEKEPPVGFEELGELEELEREVDWSTVALPREETMPNGSVAGPASPRKARQRPNVTQGSLSGLRSR